MFNFCIHDAAISGTLDDAVIRTHHHQWLPAWLISVAPVAGSLAAGPAEAHQAAPQQSHGCTAGPG